MSHTTTKTPARTYFAMMLTSRKISLSVTLNRFIFFLTRLPIVGKSIPTSLYGEYESKIALVVLANIVRLFKRLMMKALYLAFLLASCAWALDMGGRTESGLLSATIYNYALLFFFFFSYIGAGIAYGKAMNLDASLDLMLIDKFRVDSAIYIPARIFERKIIDFFASIPYAILLSTSPDYSIFDGLLILMTMAMSKMTFEALYLLFFKHLSLSKKRNRKFFNYLILVVAIAVFPAPYILIISNNTFSVSSVVLHPLFILGMIIASVLSALYVLNFQQYRELAWTSVVNFNIALEKSKNSTKDKNFATVKNAIDQDTNTAEDQMLYSHLSGYAYFNRIFVRRHRKYFNKHMLFRGCALAGISLSYIGITTFFRFFSDRPITSVSERTFHILPLCFGVFYFLSLGRSATAAMFRSCDSAMLTYPFYRESKAVLRSFYHRFKTILYYNLPTFMGILVISVGFDIFGNFFEHHTSLKSIHYIEMIPYIIACTMIWIFFSFHDLFIYYIIQPYTSELGVKSKLFNIVQGVVYYISWMNFQMSEVNMTIYMAVLIIATLIYFIIGILCINKFSAKTFRLR
ncbi:MAG: hypothetical protein GXY06_05920 [Clostridiaceae bacterium]|nr:hypothetical protein [Clostridiaceae bacterium]